MIIKSVTINNYRIYKGVNKISFSSSDEKNIFLISGENGYGKTTFLHSLIWCLYGRQITEVEPSARKEILNNGYNKYLKFNINDEIKTDFELLEGSVIEQIKKKGYTSENEYLKSITQYSVTIDLEGVAVPLLPCESLKIIRSYDLALDVENVDILINDARNELTNEIGPDVFINDFILSNDIARFFFFDSEQIVSLAGTNTISEKKKLCSAYNEVLGVRKYEELKRSLENLRLRFRKKSTNIQELDELNIHTDAKEKLISQIEINQMQTKKIEEDIRQLRHQNEELQLQLIREGSNITIQEIKRIEANINEFKKKDDEYKKQIKLFLEYAPFAITGKLLHVTKEQIVNDNKKSKSKIYQQSKNQVITDITADMLFMLNQMCLDSEMYQKLQNGVCDILNKYKCDDLKDEALIVMSEQDYEEFIAVYNNITTTYKTEFERLVTDYKKNKHSLDQNIHRLSNINCKEKDEIIKCIRSQKNMVEGSILEKEQKLRLAHEEYGILNQAFIKENKKVDELSKKVSLDGYVAQMDMVAEALINELSDFLISLKFEKKISLERRIKSIMNNLMHKENFIGSVKVLINGENMDIELYTTEGLPINKDSLSKGEQQLYATSLLKALVDESGIQFPVFIDSPLQKFDKTHSKKIITEFYPQISKQVILFPLLYKELTAEEFSVMKPLVNATYLIRNDKHHSYFEKMPIDDFLNENNNVYSYKD